MLEFQDPQQMQVAIKAINEFAAEVNAPLYNWVAPVADANLEAMVVTEVEASIDTAKAAEAPNNAGISGSTSGFNETTVMMI
jgi:hypothetical protein